MLWAWFMNMGKINDPYCDCVRKLLDKVVVSGSPRSLQCCRFPFSITTVQAKVVNNYSLARERHIQHCIFLAFFIPVACMQRAFPILITLDGSSNFKTLIHKPRP